MRELQLRTTELLSRAALADLASAKEIKREKPHTWMELHGKKKTRDFLSLYTEEPNCQPQHSRHGSQGVFMKTHDFLQPLETAEREKTTKGPTERSRSAVEHVQFGETGTCIAGHVSVPTVKPEAGTCEVRSAPESKSERDSDTGAAFAFTFWDATSGAEDRWPTRGQRPSFAVSSPPSFGSLLSSRPSYVSKVIGDLTFSYRNNEFQDNKLLMDSASRFSKGFEEEDDEGDEFGKGEGSSHKEFTIKADTKSSEQKASTPRSKHSATEQRRRSKINERFQILRALLPNSDQKRDKASFLLEVIEYIQFLQEKVQKYESFYPRWSDENSNLTSWNNQHGSGNCLADPPALNNGAASGLLASNNSIPVAPSLLSSSQNPAEPDLVAGVSYKGMENPSGFANKLAAAPPALQSNLYPSIGRGSCVDQAIQRLIPEADNMVSQPDWLRSSFPAATAISSDVINEQEELEIDEGTIRISAAYSQGLLSKLSQALQNSGIDLSQAGISVHINLRRLTGSRHVASSSMATPKDQDETEQAAKRHKSDHV